MKTPGLFWSAAVQTACRRSRHMEIPNRSIALNRFRCCSRALLGETYRAAGAEASSGSTRPSTSGYADIATRAMKKRSHAVKAVGWTSVRPGERIRVKRLGADWGSRAKIEPNTVGLSLRFGTRRPEVRILSARPTRFRALKTVDFGLVLTVLEDVGRGVGTAVENSWNMPS